MSSQGKLQAMDALMWQVPALSIAAQAFLLSIALNAESSGFAAGMAAVLALIASLSSIQLMTKHRFLEVRDSIWLEQFERKHQLDTDHAQPEKPSDDGLTSILVGISSYKLWLGTLAVFGLAAVIILLEMALP